MKKFLINIFILSLILLPVLSFAATPFDGGLVSCGKTGQEPCGFNDVMTLIDTFIKFILYMSVPICAIMFTYAGFLMLTSGGSSEQVSKARGVFTNAAIGLLFVVGAWIIVKTVLSILHYDGAGWIGF